MNKINRTTRHCETPQVSWQSISRLLSALPVLVTTLILLLTAGAFAEPSPLSFSGQLESRYAAGFRGAHAGDCLTGGLSAQGELKGSLENCTVFADGSLEYNAVTADNTNQFAANLREAWFDYTGSLFSFRIGRQISAWGAADGLIVADVLCPQNDNAFLAKNISESRLGIDAARFSFTNSTVILDAYVIPFFTPEEIPDSEDDLMHNYIFPSSVNSIQIEKPEVSLSNMEYALRLSTYLSALDFSFYGFYGYQDQPVFQISGMDFETGTVSLSGEYKKYGMAGFDASIPAGDFTVRTEAAFFPQKYFAAENMMSTERHNELKALCGLDWIHGSWTITGQYFADWITGSVSGLSEDAYTHSGTVNISCSLDRANLELSGSAVVNFKNLDSYAELGIDYDFSDSIKFNLSTKLFNPGPKNDGSYGSYKDLSCIILKGTYCF